MSPNAVLNAALLFLIALLAYAAWRSGARARRSEQALAERSRELQLIEETLRQTEERYRLIMENVSQALYIREPIAGKPPLYISRGYETIWQQPRERLYRDSRAWLEPVHRDDLPDVLAAVERDLHQEIPLNIEFRLKRPDGSLRWVHIQNFHVRDSAGKVQYIVGIIEDITEQKQAEQDRVRLALEQETSKMLRWLINNLSHDFRTPLTIINTNAYLLKQPIEPERGRELLNQIEQQVKRMDRLVQNLLMMARLEGDVRFDLQSAELNQFVQTLEPNFRAVANQQRVKLTLHLGQHPQSIRLDRHWLSMALLGLVENAVWYTPEGGSVTVSIETEDRFAVVEVRDTGVGITAEVLPHIFEPLYRADPARGSQTGGSGLGLSIARQIINLHHGEIQVESEPGKGSVFRVLLPLEESQPEEPTSS